MKAAPCTPPHTFNTIVSPPSPVCACGSGQCRAMLTCTAAASPAPTSCPRGYTHPDIRKYPHGLDRDLMACTYTAVLVGTEAHSCVSPSHPHGSHRALVSPLVNSCNCSVCAWCLLVLRTSGCCTDSCMCTLTRARASPTVPNPSREYVQFTRHGAPEQSCQHTTGHSGAAVGHPPLRHCI